VWDLQERRIKPKERGRKGRSERGGEGEEREGGWDMNEGMEGREGYKLRRKEEREVSAVFKSRYLCF